MPRRILIVRLSAIGDAIHTLPLAAALRRLYPDGFLGWLAEKPAAPLVVGNPLLDWTRVVPKGWLKNPIHVWRLRRDLKAAGFDTVLDVQGLSKSAVAAALSGAGVRIGFIRGESREIAPLLDNWLVEPRGVHAVDITLSLLAGLNQKRPSRPEFVFPPCPAGDRDAIDAFLARPPQRNGFVVMGPWGSFPAKLWPLDRFVELAARIHAKTGIASVILGHGGKERDAAAKALPGGGAAVLAPDVSPVGVAELARRAELFVGCDSFPLHAAAAVGAPAIGLFGVTDPGRLGPYGPHGESLFASLVLVRSTRERKRLPPDAICALGIERVEEACLARLRRAGTHGRPEEGRADGEARR